MLSRSKMGAIRACVRDVAGLDDDALDLVADVIEVLRERTEPLGLAAYAACTDAARRYERARGLPPP